MSRKRESFEQVLLRINSDEFIDAFNNQLLNYKQLEQKFTISWRMIAKLVKYYGLERDTSKLISKGLIGKEVDIDLIKHLYSDELLSGLKIAQKLGLDQKTVYKIIQENNWTRNNVAVRSKAMLTSDSKQQKFNEAKNNVSKDDIIHFYIEQDNSYKDTIKHFNISEHIFLKLLHEYGIKKDKAQSKLKGLKTCYQQYGSKEAYFKHLVDLQAQTNLERYGVERPLQKQEFLDKAKQTNLEKYGYECILNPNYLNNAGLHIKNSGPNLAFSKLLEDHNISYEQEFPITTKSYDFKINNVLIEINPTITHNSLWSPYGDHEGKDKKYHLQKLILAKSNNYRCIHIWDWDDQEKIIKMLQSRETIYARNCNIKEVNKHDAEVFINKYHLQGYAKDKIRLGLYYNDDLVSIMTFKTPRYNKNYEYELIRYCSSMNITGGAEKLFKYFIEAYKPTSIISYCDNSKFDGNTYINLGFNLESLGQPNKHWYNVETKQHITNNLLLQQGFDHLFGTNYGKGTSNEELIIQAGFLPVYDCGQSVYIWNN